MGLLEEKVAEEEVVSVRVVLAGVSRYPWYQEFEDFLREGLKFIKGVRLRSVMTGELTLDVEMIGDITYLLEALTTREFDEFTLEVDQGLEDQIMVRFRSRGNTGS